MPKKFKLLVCTSLIGLMGCGGNSENNPVVPSLETQKLKNTSTNSTPVPALEDQLCVAAFQLARDVCFADFRGRDRALCMQEATAQKKSCMAGEHTIEPNTFLTFIFDESEDLPSAENLSVFVDGSAVSGFDDDGRLSIFLAPGIHDIQVISSTRSAARVSLEVEEDSQIERTIVLKSESLGLIGDYDVVVLGADDDGIINVDAPFAFGVTDPEGALLPFDDITLVRVVRIESGSFVEGVGGFEVGKRELVQNRFTAQGASATISDAAAFESVVRSLGIGEYEIEVAVYDSVNDRVYEGVAFFRYGERSIEGTVDGPFDASALEINLRSADGTIQKTAITDANGRFTFENLPAAVYQLSVVVDDGGSTVRSAAGLVPTILGNAGATVTPITIKERDEGASEIEIDEGDFVALQKSGE